MLPAAGRQPTAQAYRGMTETSPSRPEARYGRSGRVRVPRRWLIGGLAALVIAAGLVIAAVAYHRLGTSSVSGTLVGYRVIDDETASVTIGVTRSDPSRPVDCIVRVRAKDGSETGRREVLVPPSTAATVQLTTTVKSSKPPAMADIYGCGTDVPAYLRPA